ncbi:Sec-independent protein translocase protein TatB [Sphingomonas sp.]|jgi:sec-independent protein translocase protein TatB|uniref:Sec-independent protein translocase protein TatB n=1 Tax=Sphingomonas sp. TaxID=28214 RepID=UPI0026264192|nr:Sec-independent protein translocase protein TatB [Sphingomonas sp.]MDF2495215.1 twin arginine-targeting protein translocase TatB [Sphingomonas sp.]
MLDFNISEMAVVAVVALLVIGPKDLPKALRVMGYWVGKARGVARQFRAGFDEMVREAELAEMEKKWKAENERIMREHPMLSPVEPTAEQPAGTADVPAIAGDAPPAGADGGGAQQQDGPVMVEQPSLWPATPPVNPDANGKAPS